MSDERLDEIFGGVEWTEEMAPGEVPEWKEGDIPEAIREGVLTIAGVKLRVAVLNSGQRVVNMDDFEELVTALEDANGE